MMHNTYIHKTSDGYEYGFIRDEWQCTGRLPYARLTEYVCVGSDYERKGIAPSFPEAQAAVAALS